jgi:protoheme IX farnesyltransferase
MSRTCNRPFVNGTLAHGPAWLLGLAGMLGLSVLATAWATNLTAAVYVFLGAFFYGVVYTVWLKRRTPLNIVIGGLAGSFAIMAGASAVTPELHALPLLFALVLFLWTPSHFWSFAIAMHDDYARARVPMLPVLIGNPAAARVVLVNTMLLVTASIIPVWFGMGTVYLVAALFGGAVFLRANLRLLRNPDRRTAMASFHASLLQLTLVLSGAMLDAHLAPVF